MSHLQFNFSHRESVTFTYIHGLTSPSTFFKPINSFLKGLLINIIAVYFAPAECDLSCPSQRQEDNESGSWPTDRPDIPATPFTQLAEEKRQYRGLMFYGLSAVAKLW